MKRSWIGAGRNLRVGSVVGMCGDNAVEAKF